MGKQVAPADRVAYGAWLRQQLDQAQIFYARLANATACSEGLITRILNGERTPNPLVQVTALLMLWAAGTFAHPEEALTGMRHLGYSLDELLLLVQQQQPLPHHYWDAAQHAATLLELHPQFLAWLKQAAAHFIHPEAQGVQLPGWHVPRPVELAAARAELLATTDSAPTVILWGPGGSGKSLLAQALLLDAEVQQRYWNGVLWARLGPQGDPGACLQTWCRWLDLKVDSASPTALRQQLREALTAPGKRYLIVVDDVWDYATLEPLWLPDANLGWLFTTRDRTLATYFPASTVQKVSAMQPAEARALLERLVGAEQLQQEPPAAGDALLAEVEYLPLAVRLLGCLIRLRGWTAVLRDVSSERTRIVTLALGPSPTTETSVRLALQVSYAALPPDLQQRFVRLGVFGYGHTFSGLVLAALWEAEAPDADWQERAALAEQALGWLYDVGLLELVSTESAFVVYRLHTLVHDYARLLLREQRAFETAQRSYVDAYLALLQNPEITAAILEEQWPNLQLAFTYALELGDYAAGLSLLERLAPFMLARAELELLEAWLGALEPQLAQLSPAAQEQWAAVEAQCLPPAL